MIIKTLIPSVVDKPHISSVWRYDALLVIRLIVTAVRSNYQYGAKYDLKLALRIQIFEYFLLDIC